METRTTQIVPSIVRGANIWDVVLLIGMGRAPFFTDAVLKSATPAVLVMRHVHQGLIAGMELLKALNNAVNPVFPVLRAKLAITAPVSAPEEAPAAMGPLIPENNATSRVLPVLKGRPVITVIVFAPVVEVSNAATARSIKVSNVMSPVLAVLQVKLVTTIPVFALEEKNPVFAAMESYRIQRNASHPVLFVPIRLETYRLNGGNVTTIAVVTNPRANPFAAME